MKVIQIPAYAYIKSNTSQRVDFSLLYSDIRPVTYLWADAEIYDAAKLINEILGDAVLSSRYKLYSVYTVQTNNPTNHPTMKDDVNEIANLFNLDLNLIEGGTVPTAPDKVVMLNNEHLGGVSWVYNSTYSSSPIYSIGFNDICAASSLDSALISFQVNNLGYEGTNTYGNMYLYLFPQLPMFNDEGAYLSPEFLAAQSARISIDFTIKKKDGKRYISRLQVSGYMSNHANVKNYLVGTVLGDFQTKNSGITETDLDPEDPYGINGTSTTGGGDGTLIARGLDAVDPAEIPDLPDINAAQLGFITMYNPTAGQLQSLADFMWSNMFDLNTYKKLFSDPMESVIGLAIVPINPSIGGSKNVHFGTIDSGVNMSFLSTNWASLDCGWCSVERYIGAFLDGDPYTKISIYLPFIGIRQLSADDINGRAIHVVYHVDVLTGACAAFIEVEGRGVMYTYNGSCITNIPLTSVNFSGAIQNAVSAVISGIGTIAGIATGAAPVTAMGAAGLLNSAANTALNSKPTVQRSGNLGGSAGIMSIMRPYIIIERPDISVPNNVQHYVGQCSNITMNLGSCSGFTMCDYIHVENVPATTEEVKEIEALLKEGVYL